MKPTFISFLSFQVAMCWSKLLAQCRCGGCGVLCCARKRPLHGGHNMPFKDSLGAATEAVSAICDIQPLTEYTLQFRRQELRSVVGIMGISGDSGSTPTPMDSCQQQHQQQQQLQLPQQHYHQNHHHHHQNGDVDRSTQNVEASNDANKRSLGDGPTTRQKILVASIWIFSAIFALATCFPDKIFGVTAQELSTRDIFFRATNSQLIATTATMTSPSHHTKELDISYCYVRSSVNMVEYAAICVAFMLPLLIGPCIVAVFQVVFFLTVYL